MLYEKHGYLGEPFQMEFLYMLYEAKTWLFGEPFQKEFLISSSFNPKWNLERSNKMTNMNNRHDKPI